MSSNIRKNIIAFTFIPALVMAALLVLSAPAVSGDNAMIEKGKAHFNNPNFAGGSKACNDCHMEGRNLEGAAGKKNFRVMGNSMATLEDVVNFCIKNATGGKPIAKDSKEMKEIVEFIRSLSPTNIGIRG